MKSRYMCSKGPEEESEASRNKNSFSRIMDLTSQTLLVDCCIIIEVSPPVSFCNLSHLKCIMLVEGM